MHCNLEVSDHRCGSDGDLRGQPVDAIYRA